MTHADPETFCMIRRIHFFCKNNAERFVLTGNTDQRTSSPGRITMAGKASFDFNCTMCGKCCREEGFVFFSRNDIRRAAKHLGMTQKSFCAEYLILTSDGYALSVTKKNPCTFLSKNGCIINKSKPKQCATFPYWNEYIGKEGELVNFDRPCPGVKKSKK
jgi:hypothetical protein